MANLSLCAVTGCGNLARSKRADYCNVHEHRFRRYGDPTAGGPLRSREGGACKADGCQKDVYSRGYCQAHYHREKRYGDPQFIKTAPPNALPDFLASFVDHSGEECVLWPFEGSTAHGYGHLVINKRTVKAHRHMCKMAHGEPPSPKRHAAHKCGKRLCVNPRHLYWATAAQNAADKLAHGTHLRGSSVGNSKLTESEVLAIKSLIPTMLQRDIAARFGVSRRMISAIKQGKRWGWLN